MSHLRQLLVAFVLIPHLIAAPCLGQKAATAKKRVAAPRAATATAPAPYGESTLGFGPIRTEEWFKNIWWERRATFANEKTEQQHSLVFLGDSITQGWSDDFQGKFRGLNVANRGISGDTTRGLLARLDEDVLSLDPSAIV